MTTKQRASSIVIVPNDIYVLHCLLTPSQMKAAPIAGGYQELSRNGQSLFLARHSITRAERLTPDRLRNGAAGLLANFPHDEPILAPIGWDGGWAAGYRSIGDLMFKSYEDTVRSGHASAVRQMISGTASADARGCLQRFVQMAQAAGVRGILTRSVSVPTRLDGLYWACVEIVSRVNTPDLLERCRAFGMTPQLFDQVNALLPQIKQGQDGRKQVLADKKPTTLLDVLKGMVDAELVSFSHVAAAHLEPERARLYRSSVLLGEPRRRGKAAPAKSGKQGPAPAQTPPAGDTTHHGGRHHAPAATGPAHHSQHGGAHHLHHPATGAVPAGPGSPGSPGSIATTVFVPGLPTGPAPGTTATPPAGATVATSPAPAGGTTAPTTATAGTATGQAALTTAQPVIPPIYLAGLEQLAPGTVLMTLPVEGGPALQAVVQADHSVKWMTEGGTATQGTHRKRHPRHRT